MKAYVNYLTKEELLEVLSKPLIERKKHSALHLEDFKEVFEYEVRIPFRVTEKEMLFYPQRPDGSKKQGLAMVLSIIPHLRMFNGKYVPGPENEFHSAANIGSMLRYKGYDFPDGFFTEIDRAGIVGVPNRPSILEYALMQNIDGYRNHIQQNRRLLFNLMRNGMRGVAEYDLIVFAKSL